MQYISLYKLFFIDEKEAKNEYDKRYNHPFSKKLNLDIKDYPSFYVVNEEMLKIIENIHLLNNKIILLTKGNRNLPLIFIDSLLRQTFIEEIQMTNEIEGVISTRKDIKVLMNAEKPTKYKRLYGLVNKYNEILNQHEFHEITSSSDIRDLYNKIIIKDIERENSSDLPDGILFRKEMVEVQSKGLAIHKGLHPESKIIDYLDKSLKILNDQSISIFIRIAIFHYFFGYIHPFYDGNGRISRFISSYYLNTQIDTLCSLQVSIACKKYQKKYYDGFKITNDIRNKGDLTYFILTFLEIFEDSLKDLVDSIIEKTNMYTTYLNIIQNRNEKNKNENNILLVLLQNYLFDIEGLSLTILLEITNISKKTLENRLKTLIEENLIHVDKTNKTYLYSLNIEKIESIQSMQHENMAI